MLTHSTHHTYEQPLAGLSQLSFSSPGFPRTPIPSRKRCTSCLDTNSLDSRRISDYESLLPADGIRTSSPGAYLRITVYSDYAHSPALKMALAEGARSTFPSQALVKEQASGTKQPHKELNSSYSMQRVCIAHLCNLHRAELHPNIHWIETTDCSF